MMCLFKMVSFFLFLFFILFSLFSFLFLFLILFLIFLILSEAGSHKPRTWSLSGAGAPQLEFGDDVGPVGCVICGAGFLMRVGQN